VAEKRTIELGSELINIVRCSFSNCITQNSREPLPHKLKIISSEPMEIRCSYFVRHQNVDEMVEFII
jgi:aspartate carbamoyltransferase regulatory subunit